MDLEGHAASSFKKIGLRAEDIHRWIDGYFDPEAFARFLHFGKKSQYNPYSHRKHRHCREALPEALKEFAGKYTPEQIREVFETHLKDDYSGYVPLRADFKDPAFLERYHSPQEESRSAEILAQEEQAAYFDQGKPGKRSRDPGFLLRITLPSLAVLVLFITTEIVFLEPILHSLLMEGKKEMLSELVTSAVSAVDFYRGLEAAGEMTREEAKNEAVLELSKLRYGLDGKDYFWITDLHPRMIMHPYRPELIGQDLSRYRDREDKSGILLFVEALKVSAATGEGFLRYRWQWKDDPHRTAPKLSFVKRVADWDWIIGSGIYIDDVEKELSRLSEQFFLLSGVVTLAAAAILLYVVQSSAKIERRRRRAEEGLKEARDRYRALVSAAREAVGLVIAGRIVYANPRFRRLSGYSGEELCRMKPEDLLEGWGKTDPASVEGETPVIMGLKTRESGELAVKVNTSRAFFSQEQGLVVSLKQVAGGWEGVEGFRGIQGYSSQPPTSFPTPLPGCRTSAELLAWGHGEMEALSKFISGGGSPEEVRIRISGLWEHYTRAALVLAEKELGTAPAPWCFFALGSLARREMTPWSDQDHGIIFHSSEGMDEGGAQKYFLALGHRVSDLLEAGGLKPCPGRIQASEPKWCRSSRQWSLIVDEWAHSDAMESALDIQVLADRRYLAGSEELMEVLSQSMSRAGRNAALLGALARRAQELRLGGLGIAHLRHPPKEGEPGIRVKGYLAILEYFARLYSLREGIPLPGTLERIHQLVEKGILSKGLQRDFEEAYGQLWDLRMELQLQAWMGLETSGDELSFQGLPLVRRRQSALLLESLDGYIDKLSRDFLGGV